MNAVKQNGAKNRKMTKLRFEGQPSHVVRTDDCFLALGGSNAQGRREENSVGSAWRDLK